MLLACHRRAQSCERSSAQVSGWKFTARLTTPHVCSQLLASNLNRNPNLNLNNLNLGYVNLRHSKDNRKTLMSDMREWTGTALEHDLEDLRAYRKLEGRRVVLQGLSSTTMNGTAGTATKFNNKRGRYFVEIDGGGRRLIKPENLRHGDADGDAAAEPQAP